jgi:hypothetical protein
LHRHFICSVSCRGSGELTNTKETLMTVHGSPGPTKVWYGEYPQIAHAVMKPVMWVAMWSYADQGRHKDKMCISGPSWGDTE